MFYEIWIGSRALALWIGVWTRGLEALWFGTNQEGILSEFEDYFMYL